MSNKPYEWWIHESGDGYSSMVEPRNAQTDKWYSKDSQCIHVIEYSAYEAVVDERARLQTQVLELALEGQKVQIARDETILDRTVKYDNLFRKWDAERARSAKLVEALKKIALEGMQLAHPIANEALAEYRADNPTELDGGVGTAERTTLPLGNIALSVQRSNPLEWAIATAKEAIRIYSRQGSKDE